MRKTIYILIGLLAMSSCTGMQEQRDKQRHTIAVEVMVVAAETEAMQHTYVGEIRPTAEYPIYYALGGSITRLHVHNGETIRKGQAIADFDDTEASSFCHAAEAVLQQAEDGHRRMQTLHDKGVITEVQWTEMETNLKKAQQNYRSAQKTLSDCHLTAPADGVIAITDIHEGQHLRPGERIGTLMDMRQVEAVFSVPENDIRQIHEGESVRIEIPAASLSTHGTISMRQLAANPLGHTYTIHAGLPREATTGLYAGMVCHIACHHHSDNASIVVPGQAVVATPDGHAVWVVANGKAMRRSVVLSGYVRNGVEVSSGLNEGDSVVVRGYQKLYTGAEVEYVK